MTNLDNKNVDDDDDDDNDDDDDDDDEEDFDFLGNLSEGYIPFAGLPEYVYAPHLNPTVQDREANELMKHKFIKLEKRVRNVEILYKRLTNNDRIKKPSKMKRKYKSGGGGIKVKKYTKKEKVLDYLKNIKIRKSSKEIVQYQNSTYEEKLNTSYLGCILTDLEKEGKIIKFKEKNKKGNEKGRFKYMIKSD